MQFSGTSSRVVVCGEDKEKVGTSSFSVAVVETAAPMIDYAEEIEVWIEELKSMVKRVCC